MDKDTSYFRRRAGEERIAAMKAANASARQAHLEMADRYDERAKAIISHQSPLNPDVVGVA